MPNLNQEYSAALPITLHDELCRHLIRSDREEELTFALWTPSRGNIRFTALLYKAIMPIEGDRQRHGNVSFNPQYFERVCQIAVKEGCGIAFIHSHPVAGWQGMSKDDIKAEHQMAGSVLALTGLPLLGMTIGSDTNWSARLWEHIGEKKYEKKWCHSVRIIGNQLRIDFTDFLIPQVEFRENFRRTATIWGVDSHQIIARSRIGIIGLGSVGAMVAEALARMGLTQFVLIDFDEIQIHNQDRLIGSKNQDIGKLKIAIAERQIRESATATQVHIATVPYSIAEKSGYRAALDCDVLFSCVDRPRPRHILNHFAYAHLIPVIDGGIDVRFRGGIFSGADWQLQTVGPTRACLKCLGTYNYADVSTEIEGMLDDPRYLNGLPNNHRFKQNENVFPFSANLAMLEVLQLVALTTGIAGINNFGVQRYRYNPGILETDIERNCKEGCKSSALTARGDHFFHLYGIDLGAQVARQRQKQKMD